MESSLFLARLIGLVLLVLALAFVFNKHFFKKVAKELLKFEALFFLSGLFALVMGASIVLTHNIWEMEWPVLVTLFGWIALVKGVCRLVLPEQSRDWIKHILKNEELFGVAIIGMLILGGVFAYFGFWA